MRRFRFSIRRSTAIAVVITAALALPLGVFASHQWNDVPDSNTFHGDIDAITDAGVTTTGCGGGNFCPDANVTRGQMAAFMNRLGALGPGKDPVVNAATAEKTDGWSLGCPTGTVWSQGLCFETTNRAADTVYDASEICAGLGLIGGWRYRLPTVHQLRAARGVTNITLDAGGEHTDSLFREWDGDSNNYHSITVTDAGAVASVIGNTLRKFRCVTPPQSLDFFFIPLSEQEAYPEPPSYSGTEVNSDGSPAE
jgi:hypothetical protein